MKLGNFELNKIYAMDCLEGLKQLPDESVDLVVTDPPYGYSFMGKDWDKVVIPTPYWKEALRVLKPGAFAYVMSAPRQDVLSRAIVNLQDAGFETGFSSVYWAYASGFPKASNISLMIDKKACREQLTERLGRPPTKEEFKKAWGEFREVVGRKVVNTLLGKKELKGDGRSANPENTITNMGLKGDGRSANPENTITNMGIGFGDWDLTLPTTPQAKALNGSYGGFQPKPAVEVIIVAMKPLSEKTYVDQALANRHGITWLDDVRIPYESEDDFENAKGGNTPYKGKNMFGVEDNRTQEDRISTQGRFPANLFVSDDVLNDGRIRKTGDIKPYENKGAKYSCFGQTPPYININFKGDSGSFSRYFDLDKWWEKKVSELPKEVQKVFPFLIVPKASKSEKNRGLERFINIEIYLLKQGSDKGKWNEKSLIKEERLAHLQLDMGQYPPKVIYEYGIQNKKDTVWSMMLFGKNIMEKYQKDFISIIKTETNSTTKSRILNWLTHLLTKEYIVDVKKLQENGGSHARSVEKFNQLVISINERMASVLGVNDVVSGMRLKIKLKDGRCEHPTVKPIKLMSLLITLGSRKGDTILDPFAGSGSTLISAKLLGRNYIGFELNEEYVKIAEARLRAVPEPLTKWAGGNNVHK